MIAVIQRSSKANVKVNDNIIGKIDYGLVILLGVKKGDIEKDAESLAQKISTLRIFNDDDDKMNLSITDIGGSALVISQFTLCSDTRKVWKQSKLSFEKYKDKYVTYYKYKTKYPHAGAGKRVQF